MDTEKVEKTDKLTVYTGSSNQKKDKITIFSIGIKLVTIVSIIVLISLGSITALVSWLVREDLQIAAEENNFEANRRSSSEAEDILARMRSNALMLIHTINSVGTQSALAKSNSSYFFKQNPNIAALFFTLPGDSEELINEQFFISKNISSSLASSFTAKQRITLRRSSAGETIVLNATPHFSIHVLALFFPTETGSAIVLFSPENLSASFGLGTSQSWMINSSGDILVHTDYEHMRNGTNVLDLDFIRSMQESPHRSSQALIETDFGIMKSNAADQNLILVVWEKIKQKVVFSINTVSNLLKINRNISLNQSELSETVRQFIAYTKLGIGGCTVITNIEYDKVFEGIAATTRRNIYLTIAVLSFSIMFIWFFAKTISVPLKTLAAAARKIESGIFEIELKPKGRDEIGFLTNSFQKMCSALHIFGRFTNREIAIKAMRNEIKPGGLSKHATIFFSDIRGFTAKSENFTKVFGADASNKIVFWLNNYFSQMINCIEENNGTIDKFIGDAVMAHWGTVYTSGSAVQDAYDCVKAALFMRKALYEMNKERREDDPGNPMISIGCGINTGIVTAGQLGSDMRMEYTVIGDPVNLASRIESLNKPFGTDILISENTWELVNKYFLTAEMPPVTVKGKEKPLRIFAVINFAGIDKKPQTLADVRSILGIEAPGNLNASLNASEKKYKISEEER